MIDPEGIDHICLSVSDLNRAKIYYERVFGVKCRPREDNLKTLIVESNNIHFFLMQTDASSKFLSNQHLSFRVGDLSEVIAQLETLGITDFQTGEIKFFEHNNYRWCEWRDPDGIRLECVQLL